jgi:hypothetical protein
MRASAKVASQDQTKRRRKELINQDPVIRDDTTNPPTDGMDRTHTLSKSLSPTLLLPSLPPRTAPLGHPPLVRKRLFRVHLHLLASGYQAGELDPHAVFYRVELVEHDLDGFGEEFLGLVGACRFDRVYGFARARGGFGRFCQSRPPLPNLACLISPSLDLQMK